LIFLLNRLFALSAPAILGTGGGLHPEPGADLRVPQRPDHDLLQGRDLLFQTAEVRVTDAVLLLGGALRLDPVMDGLALRPARVLGVLLLPFASTIPAVLHGQVGLARANLASAQLGGRPARPLRRGRRRHELLFVYVLDHQVRLPDLHLRNRPLHRLHEGLPRLPFILFEHAPEPLGHVLRVVHAVVLCILLDPGDQ